MVTCPPSCWVAPDCPDDPVCAGQLSWVPLWNWQPQTLPLLALCVCIPAAESAQGGIVRRTAEETVRGTVGGSVVGTVMGTVLLTP